MRKQKLRSSIRAIQEAIIGPKSMSPVCTPQSETNSFKDEASDFSSSVISNRLFFSPSMTRSIMEEARARPSNLNTEKLDNGDFFNGSMVTVLASNDPFMDFKSSMEEMVKAHGVREWVQLEELLLCYLRLNERRNHEAIVMAFVDFVKNLVHNQCRGFPSPFGSSSFPMLISDQ